MKLLGEWGATMLTTIPTKEHSHRATLIEGVLRGSWASDEEALADLTHVGMTYHEYHSRKSEIKNFLIDLVLSKTQPDPVADRAFDRYLQIGRVKGMCERYLECVDRSYEVSLRVTIIEEVIRTLRFYGLYEALPEIDAILNQPAYEAAVSTDGADRWQSTLRKLDGLVTHVLQVRDFSEKVRRMGTVFSVSSNPGQRFEAPDPELVSAFDVWGRVAKLCTDVQRGEVVMNKAALDWMLALVKKRPELISHDFFTLVFTIVEAFQVSLPTGEARAITDLDRSFEHTGAARY